MNPDLQSFLQAWTGGADVSDAERTRLLQRFEIDAPFRAECVEEIRLLGLIKAVQTPSPRWLDLQDALGTSNLETTEATPDDLATRVLHHVQEEPRPLVNTRWFQWQPLVASAAAVTLLCAGWFWLEADTAQVTVSTAAEIRSGQRLGHGLHEIASGTVELLTDRGARLVIEAPAKFMFSSAQRLRLDRGRVSADVPPSAHGFTVVTATGEVVDLGTRFGVDADARGGSEVHVFEGEVIAQAGQRLSLKTGDAAALRTAHVTRRDLRDAAFIQPAENASLAEGVRQGRQTQALELKGRYLKDAALLTWEDFEFKHEDGSFRRVQGRWPGSVALEFVEQGDYAPMNLSTEARQFTMLAWVRLDRLPTAMQSIYHGQDYIEQRGTVHWLVRQGTGTMLLPVSGTQRLAFDPNKEPDNLKTYPGSQHSLSGSVGRWTLMAVTYDSETGTVRFFQDGRLDNEERVNPGVTARFASARLGNWNRQERVLSGRLDDFVVLSRVLPANEILAFFEATKPY
jgi:hypothetical protein